MVIFAIELRQLRLEVGEDATQVVQYHFGEDAAPILGDKDQVNVHQENAMPAVANVVVVTHRPPYTIHMQRIQAFKYELRPDGQQARQMARFAGSCRFVYNKALAMQKANHEAGGRQHRAAG